MSLRIAVCITTHNRHAELARALAALATLAPAPDEILIAADGCNDATVDWLREEYPAAQVIVHRVARGSIASRNELASFATAELLLSLDDDSHPLDSDFVARIRELFENHPRLAVATFPQRTDEFPETLAATDFGPDEFVGSFVNSGAVIRRAVLLELGGYPDFFFHAYEEPDFALRCVTAGWEVRRITSLTIRHFFTPTERNEMRTHHRHSRNELWSVLLRCPMPQLAAVVLFRVVRQLGYARKRGLAWVLREPVWWLACLRGMPRCLAQRRPLPWRPYLAWMRLVNAPLSDAAEWNRRFGKDAA